MQLPGEALLIKLWETLAEKGIGSLLRPWQMRREASVTLEVQRATTLALAQAEKEAQAIRNGQASFDVPNRILTLAPAASEMPATTTAMADLPVIALRNLAADAIDKEVNTAKAILKAESELENDTTPPSTIRVEADWLHRWRESAAAVSSDDLQTLWGRVLAGEVKAPGRYSLRTLEFLRNLSQEEAKRIEQIAPLIVAGLLIYGAKNSLEALGLSHMNLVRLQELGVLSGVEALGVTGSLVSFSQTEFLRTLTCHGFALVAKAADPTMQIKLSGYPLTTVGSQVVELGSFSANQEYLKEIGLLIKAQGFSVLFGRFETVDANRIQLLEEEAL